MYIIGIDIGGTNMRVGLFKDGNMIKKTSVFTRTEEGVVAIITRLKQLIVNVLEQANIEMGQVKGIGVGCPGPLDPWKGEIQSPPNLPGWDHIPLKKILEEEYSLPVFLHNDANAAALGEYTFAYNRNVNNLVYITVSTGVGGGVVADGRLLLGVNGSAAEIGHMIINPNGNLCSCGNRGCLEAQASGTGIVSKTKALLQTTKEASVLKGKSKLTSKDVFVAAENGDALCKRIIEEVQFDLALGLTNIVHAYNPEMVVYGGGVMQAGESFIKPVIEKAEKMILPGMKGRLTFAATKLGGELGLYGAAALVDYFQE
ncbi:ROK family protein [Evansella cellulosilytica]|uniref:ROK family protein n=1 Tax=Evansella cellulosilytica (strain ATCC 21833 / DSM 2522 / FERM P-1141 / JCM 9156 / N-4) TaxID=649639 RepID=E6TUZ0_EVAC2|nr:ROK family protein [Evansella cellulosilytica]ADU28573.1 ROK family protein [Evansella cellulosilytica DSM 2522]